MASWSNPRGRPDTSTHSVPDRRASRDFLIRGSVSDLALPALTTVLLARGKPMTYSELGGTRHAHGL